MANTVSMPIGIPQPIIDFSEDMPKHPASWEVGTESIGYYYVNTLHADATDSDNDYGTPQKPRITIPVTIAAGSLVVIRGTYSRDQGGRTWFRCEGNDEEWVAGRRGKVYVDGGIGQPDEALFTYHVTIIGSYFLIDGITLVNERQLNLGSTTPDRYTGYGTLRNSQLLGSGSLKSTACAIAAPNNIEGSKSEHIVFWKNTIRKYGPWLANDKDVDANGLNINGDVENIWVLDSYIGETSGSGIQLSPTKPSDRKSSTRRIFIGRNEISYCSQAGIGGKYPSDTIISQNYIHNIYDRTWTPSKAIGMQYAPENIWMLYNLIVDCRYGIRGAGTNNTDDGWKMYSIGNVIINANRTNEAGVNYDNTKPYNNASAFASQGYYDWFIANNLVVNSEAFFTTPSYHDTYRIQNNILSSITEAVFVGYSGIPLNRVKNNIFSRVNDYYRKPEYTYNTISELEEYIGNSENFYETLPNVEGKSTEEIIAIFSDLSRMVDAGLDMPADVYDKFIDTFGFPLNRGYYDKVVPQGARVDIGPWEYGDEFVAIVPAAPIDLYIDALTSTLHWSAASLNTEEYVIYKDDVELARVTSDELSSVIAGIATSVNSYSVSALNATGSSISVPILSAVITVNEFDNVVVDTDKSYKVFRSALDSTKGMMISALKSTGSLYGFGYPDASYTVGNFSEDGYMYSLSNETLEGTIQGTGTVSIYLCMSNYSEDTNTFNFTIGGTRLTLDLGTDYLNKAYKQYKFTIEIDGSVSYEFSSTGKDGKGHCGLIAITDDTIPVYAELPEPTFTYTIEDETTFNFTAEGAYAYEWLIDGKSYTGSSAEVTFTTEDSYTIQLTGYNVDGAPVTYSEDVVVTISNKKPEVSFSYVSDYLNIVVTSTVVDESIASYYYDFGDGSGSSAIPNPEYTYTSNGTYTITLTVTDTEGLQASATESVTVSDVIETPEEPLDSPTVRLLAIGDSITSQGDSNGSDSDRFANQSLNCYFRAYYVASAMMQCESDYLVLDNQGYSGFTTDKFLSTGKMPSVLSSSADLVLMGFGTNDAQQGSSNADIQADYLNIVTQILNAGKKVLILPCTHVNVATGAEDNEKIDILNEYLITLAASTDGVEIAPVSTEFNALIAEDAFSLTRDGIHPNNRGGMIYGKTLAPFMDENYPSIIEDKVNYIPEFFGDAGSVPYSNGTVPTGWYGYRGLAWLHSVDLGDDKQWMQVTTNGSGNVSKSNNTSYLKITGIPSEYEGQDGWYIGELEINLINSSALNSIRLEVNGSDATYGSCQTTAFTPRTAGAYPDGSYRVRTPRFRLGVNGLADFKFETEQDTGDDVIIQISSPKIYKLEDV